LKELENIPVPKTAFVLFNNGAFGGAEKRFLNLFQYLSGLYPDKFYFFINKHLLDHIVRIYFDFPTTNIRIVDFKRPVSKLKKRGLSSSPNTYSDIIPDPMEVDRKTSFARKIYWFHKNKIRQRHLFNIIEQFRKELDIEVFIGVFSGVLPLVFYLSQQPRQAAVIFSNMDSWFTGVHDDMKKLWYRKYFSFNYALENSDYVDFLSPYIVEGVKKRNVNVPADKTVITACSGVDYSNCHVGSKTNLEIAFSGRLEPDKCPMLYLEAAKEILKEYPNIKFHLLGEGSLVKEINNFIDSSGLRDKINFQFHKNPPELFAGTSIFVSLQTGTNYPSLSVIEAMACGNAVVASNVGDTTLLINENNGVLAELNVDSVVAAIKSLIKDPARISKLGLNGREFVMKEHIIEKESAYYIDLFKKAKNRVFGFKESS
jgi:glycosyltransferase involved in cell wall biosynthesis